VFLVAEVPKCECWTCGRSFEIHPPFAAAYVGYTHRLQALIEDLRGFITMADLPVVTGLSWETVKNIIKSRLEQEWWPAAVQGPATPLGRRDLPGTA
jgi:hypothetical protein